MEKLPVRERILNTATNLFYIQGVKNTGINQIIAESRVAKASFYQHFPSKEILILACLDEYYDSLSKVLKRLSGRCRSLPEFFKKWNRLIKKNATINTSFMGCPVANIGFQVDSDNPDIKKKFNEIIDGWFLILKPLFEKARESGEITEPGDLKKLFGDIFAINEGALLMWRLTGDHGYLDNIYKSILKIL